jgi:predicted nucleic acid-binding protein
VRIVLDTNVLFAAFVAHGVCAGLYEECLLRGRIVVSLFILRELEEKLFSKARLSQSEAGDIIDAVKADAEITETRPLAARVCRDADDDWILARGMRPAWAAAAFTDRSSVLAAPSRLEKSSFMLRKTTPPDWNRRRTAERRG